MGVTLLDPPAPRAPATIGEALLADVYAEVPEEELRPRRITPNLSLPVPGDTDPADAPTDIGNLADRLDAVLSRWIYPGLIIPSGRADEPPGWLLCNGQAVGRALYAALFAAVGTTFGGGDGTTTFNVPNMVNTVPLGASGGRPRGTRGGAELVALSANQSGVNGYGSTGLQNADHSHYVAGGTDVDQPDHSHGIGGWLAQYTGGPNNASGIGEPAFIYYTTGRSNYHTHGFAAWSGGVSANHAHAFNARNADEAHENMPPFVAVNMLIKT